MWLSGLVVIYLGLPLIVFMSNLARSPRRGFHSAGLFPALWLSASGATISLVLISLTGIPLSFVLARSRSRFAFVVGVIVQIPLALPPLMSGIILVYVVGPYTFLGRLFHGGLTNSVTGVVLAMSFVSAPFLIVAARASFVSMDQGLLDVAATLGHTPMSRFLRVALPAAGPGIRAGMLLAWLRAFGEYGAVVVLAYNPMSLPVYTYSQFSGVGLPTTLAPTALAMVVAVSVIAVSHVSRLGTLRRRAVVPISEIPPPTRSEPVGFDIDHSFGSFRLTLAHEPRGRNLAVLGPSGSGKSSLLRSLAGFYGSTPGEVVYGAQPVTTLVTEKRRVGYVAQGFSLYPHLTVWRQLTFSPESSPELAAYWLEHLYLLGLENRYPAEISGGQRQRVALAQALCRSPRVLLLDEPFSALDMPVRRELRRELRQLQIKTGIATVLVTHDPEEAAYLADDVIVVEAGRALQSGTSREVFSFPNSPDVARLVGVANVHRARVVSDDAIDAGGVRIPADVTGIALGMEVLWSARPERLGILPVDVTGPVLHTSVLGKLVETVDVGMAFESLVILSEGIELRVRSDEPVAVAVGESCRVELNADCLAVWPEAEGRMISDVNDGGTLRNASESRRQRSSL